MTSPSEQNQLDGRRAVVTGAASGIGAATARRLVADGAAVGLLARRADRLRAIEDELGADRVLAVPTDVTDAAALTEAANAIRRRFGVVDLVVANAGIMLPSPVAELRTVEWQAMVDLNLTGLLQTVAAFLPALLEAGQNDSPTDLILMSSLGARETFPGYGVYGATKAAVSYLARAWRSELAPQGVRVTAVEPGLTQSELADRVTHPDQAGELEAMFDSMESLRAEDVADLVSHLAALPRHASMPTATILPAQQA